MEPEALEDEAPAVPDDPRPATTRLTSSLTAATGVLVVDVSNLAWRACYANSELRTSTGVFSGHVFGALKILRALVQNQLDAGAWLLCLCYDGAGAKAARQRILPAYKADRDPLRFNPVADVKEAFHHLPGLHVEHAEREGDDAMIWAAQNLGGPRRQVVLFSNDKDVWTQVGRPGVRVFSATRERFVTMQDVEEEYFVQDPAQVSVAKAFFGDSDNVKGVFGLIRKTLAPHLNDPRGTRVGAVCTLARYAAEEAAQALAATPLKGKPKQALKQRAVAAAKLAAKLTAEEGRLHLNHAVTSSNTSGFDKTNILRSLGNRNALYELLGFYECATLQEKIGTFFGDEMRNYIED